jgi:hypothetical protein
MFSDKTGSSEHDIDPQSSNECADQTTVKP